MVLVLFVLHTVVMSGDGAGPRLRYSEVKNIEDQNRHFAGCNCQASRNVREKIDFALEVTVYWPFYLSDMAASFALELLSRSPENSSCKRHV